MGSVEKKKGGGGGLFIGIKPARRRAIKEGDTVDAIKNTREGNSLLNYSWSVLPGCACRVGETCHEP